MTIRLCMPSICWSRVFTNSNHAVEETPCASGAVRGTALAACPRFKAPVRRRTEQIRRMLFIGGSGVVTQPWPRCHERKHLHRTGALIAESASLDPLYARVDLEIGAPLPRKKGALPN